ncbi:MAG: YbdD/YjiX family protein [Polyangiales bacterium]
MTRLASAGFWPRAWLLIRELAGDTAYARYCEHQRSVHPDAPLLDRRAYYLRSLEQKWSGVSRCC